MKLFALCDSPSTQTGFARVAKNLLTRWHKSGGGPFDEIDVWGIGYNGWPHNLPFKIYPGGSEGWDSKQKLESFLSLLKDSGASHVFLLMDIVQLSLRGFPADLKKACDDAGIKSVVYFPIDCQQEKEWTEIVTHCDIPIAYTESGRAEIERLIGTKHKVHVIQHGTDTKVYRPFVPAEKRSELRTQMFRGWLADDDIFIMNVNTHTRRKSVVHTLQITSMLRKMGFPVKLLMHMKAWNPDDRTNLEMMAAQFGLKIGRDWAHHESKFTGWQPRITEEGLAQLYTASDYYLSTSLGEGWGLPALEAVACGATALVPAHTAHLDIEHELRTRAFADGAPWLKYNLLPVSNIAVVNPVDMSRVRFPVDTEKAANQIADLIKKGVHTDRTTFTPSQAQWQSWDGIAKVFIDLMQVQKP